MIPQYVFLFMMIERKIDMNLLYVPLDERPCNALYPQMISELTENVNLIVPPNDLLGEKKRAANVSLLWEWIEKEIKQCEAAILSVEMIVYGGLLPSRLHHMTPQECIDRLSNIKKLKTINPGVKIYVSNLIMRTPSYSSSEEEPDYYEQYGAMIFEYGYLKDQKSREGINEDQQKKLDMLSSTIPANFIDDYETRRKTNNEINKNVIEYVREGVIDFLSIPQDDCAPYGYTAIDQKNIIPLIAGYRLQNRIHTYPGADEVGCTLLSRIYSAKLSKVPNVYVFYSSTLGPQIVPKYEDRPLNESIKAHILAAGGRIVNNAEEADLILAVNSPGKYMQEASIQMNKDISYTSYRNLREFVYNIKHYTSQGKKCIVGDVAFGNGGDTELVTMLDEENCLDKLLGYAGWNTSCNTLGTVIATGIIGLESNNTAARIKNLTYRIIEDWGYQSLVRQNTIKNVLPLHNASYYNFNGQEKNIQEAIREQLLELWNREVRNCFKDWNVEINKIFMPWHRMFEIGMEMYVKKSEE